MGSREEDKAMAGLLRRTLASDAAKDCPAPEILAAYFDRSLDADETARYELHFSQCSRCREQLAAMGRASGADAGDKKAASSWNWLRTPHWLMPAAAAFAVLVLVAGVTLHRWKSVGVANQVAMSRPDALPVPLSAPESRDTAPPAPSESSAPATPASRAAEPKNQLLSGSAARDKTAQELYSRALRSNGLKKQRDEAKGAREKNSPTVAAAGAGLSADATVTEAPPVMDAQALELAPSEVEPNSVAGGVGAPAPEEEAEKAGARKEKTSSRPMAPAQAAAASHLAAASNFADRSARDSAERARIQRAQLSSNLIAGFMVQSLDSNVLWMVSDSGSIGRSEDAGKTWKYESLATGDHFVAGSAPTGQICWLVGDRGAILRTTDGKTWTTVAPPADANFERFVGVEARDELSATVTTEDGRKFSTTDGGKTWTLAK